MLIPSLLKRNVAMSRTSILKRSLSAAAAVALLAALLSPANAAYRQDSIAVFPDLSISAATDRAPIVLTSRLSWLAPVGHRQPHQADVPQHEAVSAWEQQQQQFDQELDRKLISGRGCCPVAGRSFPGGISPSPTYPLPRAAVSFRFLRVSSTKRAAPPSSTQTPKENRHVASRQARRFQSRFRSRKAALQRSLLSHRDDAPRR